MAVLDNVRVNLSGSTVAIPPEIEAIVGRAYKRALWEWFHEDPDDVLIERKFGVWKFNFTLRLRRRDLRPVIELLAGPDPT